MDGNSGGAATATGNSVFLSGAPGIASSFLYGGMASGDAEKYLMKKKHEQAGN